MVFLFLRHMHQQSIGVFDSGYGGLTVLKEIVNRLPQYDYVYMGDNARAPYGNRSFDSVYQYTWQSVQWFFNQGCPLVILACNTASAKALRTIQQKHANEIGKDRRVLGVIRPTAEVIGNYSKSRKVGILATKGTVLSNSYPIEIKKFFDDVEVVQEACPLWVSLIENNEHESNGADYFVKKHISNLLHKQKNIDVFLLACTHYPLLWNKIVEYTPVDIKLISQGEIVANSLANYLQRHPEMDAQLSRNGNTSFYTTENATEFNEHGAAFYGQPIHAKQIFVEKI